MSLFQYDFKCPKCGRKDIDLEEGIWLFYEAETDIYKCMYCGHLFSNTHESGERDSSASCPKCGGYLCQKGQSLDITLKVTITPEN